MKRALLGLIALNTAAFANGFVTNEYVGNVNHKTSETVNVKAANKTDLGVYFGPEKEVFVFSGLKFAGEKLFTENYDNKTPQFYAGYSLDATVSNNFDISSYLIYKTESNKDNKELLKGLIEKHQTERGTKKNNETVGYFKDKEKYEKKLDDDKKEDHGKTILAGLAFEGRGKYGKINGATELATNNFTSESNIYSVLKTETMLNKSILGSRVFHEIDLTKLGKDQGYGKLNAELTHKYSEGKLGLNNKVFFNTDSILLKTTDNVSKDRYDFKIGTENELTYQVTPNTKVVGAVNYTALLENSENDLNTNKIQTFTNTPELKFALETKNSKAEFKSLNLLKSDVKLAIYGDKDAFEFDKYSVYGRTENDLTYKASENVDLGLVVNFNTLFDSKFDSNKEKTGNKATEKDHYKYRMENNIVAKTRLNWRAFNNQLKSFNGLGYSFGTKLDLDETTAKIKDRNFPELHTLFGFTRNELDVKVNDVVTVKGNYSLHSYTRSNFYANLEGNDLGLKLGVGIASKANLGLEITKGITKFNTTLEGQYLLNTDKINKETLDRIIDANNDDNAGAVFVVGNVINNVSGAKAMLKNNLEIKATEKATVNLGFDVSYAYRMDKDKNYENMAKFIEDAGYTDNKRFENLDKFVEKIDKDNVKYDFADKHYVSIVPKASAEVKFLEDKLTFKPEGKVVVKFESTDLATLPKYNTVETELKLNLNYAW